MFPNFDDDGFLPHGVHPCRGEDFLSHFISTKDREFYRQSILNVFDFAAHYGAVSVLVGGSFVTNKPDPRDFDCVILFRKMEQIPPKIESLDVGGNSIDIFFASMDQEKLIPSFLKLLTNNRFGNKVGVVEVQICSNDAPVWDITWEPDEDVFEIVRRAYINRHFVDKINRKKTLVTVHGIRTHAEWNAEVVLNASANGWTVAPFQYGYVDVDIFLRKGKRQEIVDEFRDFLAGLSKSYGSSDVSVIAHSLGTYVVCSYILGFGDFPPTCFDTLILCGAIVNHELDLDLFSGRVANIINEQAPNDEWAEWARIVNFGKDELFGYAGTRGFSRPTERLTQSSSPIFTHNNVIRRDVISQRWLPALEANRGSVQREALNKIINKFR